MFQRKNKTKSQEKKTLLMWASLMVQIVKNPTGMWKTWIRSLGWEGPQKEGMATHSSKDK